MARTDSFINKAPTGNKYVPPMRPREQTQSASLFDRALSIYGLSAGREPGMGGRGFSRVLDLQSSPAFGSGRPAQSGNLNPKKIALLLKLLQGGGMSR